MLALGIILLIIAAGVIVLVLAGASNEVASFDVGAFSVEMNTLGVFVTGAATVLLLMLGLALMRSGTRRANRRRKEKKELHRQLDSRESASATDAGTSDTARTDSTTRGDGEATDPDRSTH